MTEERPDLSEDFTPLDIDHENMPWGDCLDEYPPDFDGEETPRRSPKH